MSPIQSKIKPAKPAFWWALAAAGFLGLSPNSAWTQPLAPKYAGSYCDLVVKACPRDFANKIITVPKNTVALSAIMPVCDETAQIPQPEIVPPSVVFIIDNSGSMSMAGLPNGSDPDESRFDQTIKMIDALYATTPKARVSLVSFSRRLQYDNRDLHHLASAFPLDPTQHDAYVPLTRLDSAFANGVLGIDTLKAMLKHNSDGDLDYDGRKWPNSRPNTGGGNTRQGVDSMDMRFGTDITLGFDAAKEAMKAAPAGTNQYQFFVFLSDGEPGSLDDTRQPMSNDFLQGTGAPTTFTVFFLANQNGNRTGLNNVQTMTTNIKANGYSTMNPKSAVWDIQNPTTQLETLLQTEILKNILTTVPTVAQSASISTGAQKQLSTTLQNGSFVFQKRIPLDSVRTIFTFDVVYSYMDNSGPTPVPATKPVTYTITIDRTGAANPLGTDTTCHDAPQIALMSNGKTLTTVNADHTAMQVAVTLPAGQRCTSCTVQLSSTNGTDKELLAVTGVANILTANFTRNTTSAMVPGNGVLENLGINDSVVVLFMNPEYPLEVSRRVFKYEDISTILDTKWLNDVAALPADDPTTTMGTHFILVGATNLQATPTQGNTNCCKPQGNWNPSNLADTAKYVGININATREFSAEVRIYDNFGILVNKTAFEISKTEFTKLPYDAKTKSRSVGFLWNGRSKDGAKVGTGAYIILGNIHLTNEVGVAEDNVSTVIRRRVGLVRNAL